jgi:hypothetical protein
MASPSPTAPGRELSSRDRAFRAVGIERSRWSRDQTGIAMFPVSRLEADTDWESPIPLNCRSRFEAVSCSQVWHANFRNPKR